MASQNHIPTSSPQSLPRLLHDDGHDTASESILTPDSEAFRSTTPASFSTFSISSTMSSRPLRDDDGRKYQAENDEYALPADGPECARLEYQHKAFKIMQGNANYLCPMKAVLKDGGRGKRVLDIGTATGIWVIEMAHEFPLAELVGCDLAPNQRQQNVPDAVQWIIEDVQQGLPYPDGYFDVVHTRMLSLGIRSWDVVFREMMRLLAPDGLLCCVEMDKDLLRLLPDGPLTRTSSLNEPFRLDGMDETECYRVAPGFQKWMQNLHAAIAARGIDQLGGSVTIPNLCIQYGLREYAQHRRLVPLWAWSDEPELKAAGDIMYYDSLEVPESGRHLITDACNLSSDEYDKLKEGWLADLNTRGQSAIMVIYNWGFKA